MKKSSVLIVMLALALALPVFGLAEAAATDTPATPAPTTPWGIGRGYRWQQTPPAAPQNNFVDENQDGVCDNCGQTPGQNPQAPGFVDADQDGVCDKFGTQAQFQGRGMMGRQQGMRGQMQGMRGQMQGMRGRMHRMQNQTNGYQPGRGFVDANNDGICDLFQNNTPRQPGGRFRR